MKLAILVGNGKKIGLLTLPFLVTGIVLNMAFPSLFAVGGPSMPLTIFSILMLIPGILIWVWSVVLILTRIPRKQLITTGPYALVKHPLYCGVALLVLPWVGFLLNTWLGAVIGLVVYAGSRLFAPEEEKVLEKLFRDQWTDYCARVKIPWL